MKTHKSLIAYLIIIALLSGLFIVGMLAFRQYGAFLAQGYMLLPAIAAIVTRVFFDPQKFTDAHLRLGRWRDYLKFWLWGLAISALTFLVYSLSGAGVWDFSGQLFLDHLAAQFAAVGQDINTATPTGLTPQMMLWLYFFGGLTIFNLMPGLITGFGEEFGWRGLLFPRLYQLRPWAAFIIGGLIWYAWHLPLMLVVPQQIDPPSLLILLPILALGSICTHTYLAYVYVKTNSVFVTALAHITLNNAQASLSYFFDVRHMLLANMGLTLVMLMVVAFLGIAGRFKAFEQYFSKPAIGG
jgi:membrane protease YdiL (CAAX protease family)